MKILPVVYKSIPLVMPDGSIHRVAFQVYQSEGETFLRLGNNMLTFNKDGTFDGCEARLTADMVPEYQKALEEPCKNITPEDTYHQPGTKGYMAEIRGYMHQQGGGQGETYGVVFKKKEKPQ